jgi:hypothetical protein
MGKYGYFKKRFSSCYLNSNVLIKGLEGLSHKDTKTCSKYWYPYYYTAHMGDTILENKKSRYEIRNGFFFFARKKITFFS